MPIVKDEVLAGLIAVAFKALRVKKIIIGSFFLILSFLIYILILNSVALIDSADWVPSALPSFAVPQTVVSSIVFYLGLAVLILIVMDGMTAIAKFDYEEISGHRFYPMRSAMRFGFSRFKQLLMSEAAIILFLLFVILLGAAIGLLTRLPVLGDILFSVFFVFPNFVVAMLAVLVIFALAASIMIMPAAVAADKKGEAFNSIQETFSTIIRRPIHWTVLTIYSLIWAKIGGFVFAYFSYRAVQFIKFSTMLGGGEKTANLIGGGLSHLPLHSPPAYHTFSLFPGSRIGIHLDSLLSAGGTGWAGYLMALSLFLIFVLIWGYIFSVIATGQAYLFAYIRKIRGIEKAKRYQK
ncbi:conserved membrane hypothetical protein [Candidatus Zixiibacteriota bacterium]|nr:conserved membrane hypothetical protein [candidate division Zixibacteria bacterium]